MDTWGNIGNRKITTRVLYILRVLTFIFSILAYSYKIIKNRIFAQPTLLAANAMFLPLSIVYAEYKRLWIRLIKV